jgi:hypothetical protein
LLDPEPVQSTVPIGRDDSCLHDIELRYEFQDDDIPQNLDLHLGGENDTTQPLPNFAGHQPSVDRTLLGITNSTPLSLQPSYHDHMNQVWDIFISLMSNQPCNYNEVTKGVESLEALKTYFNSKRGQPAISSNVSEERERDRDRDRETYQCLLCDIQKKKKVVIHSFGSLKRHLGTMHEIYDSQFCCSVLSCSKTFYRRDRMREHMTFAHKQVDLKAADVEATRVKVPSPVFCPLCPENIESWDLLFKHLKRHCLVGSGSVGGSDEGDRPRRGVNDNGDGNDGNANGPSSGRPNNAWGAPSHHQGEITPIEEFSMDDLFNPPFDPSFHFAGGLNRQPSHAPPPHNPGLSQLDQLKRKRQNKEKKPSDQQPSTSRKCKRCNHDLGKCGHCSHFTESVRACHRCTDQPGVAIQESSSSGMPIQTRQDPSSSTLVTLDPSYLGPSAQGGDFELFQPMPTQQLYYPDGAMQYTGLQTQRRSFDSATDTFIDELSPAHSFVNVAIVVEDHRPLYDIQNKAQQSPVFNCDLKLLSKIGLGPIIEPFSPKRQIEQSKKRASLALAPGTNIDFVLRDAPPSSTPRIPSPVSQCKCSCVTMPVVRYNAQARARLSPLELVEMTFKMSPITRESGHPLRTRVQVVVKLLRLRSSVSTSRKKKTQRNLYITSEPNSEADAEPDTDSDHDPSTSPSGDELAQVISWTEVVEDWSFEFDLKGALLKLARWTNNENADTCSKLFLSDPGYILDLISMYIMYRFKLCWMLGRTGLNLFMSI